MTMEVFCDDNPISVEHLPTLEKIDSVYQEKGSAVAYIEGTRTCGTLRGGSSKGKPFEFTFKDRYHHNWKVIMGRNVLNVLKMLIPCGSDITWQTPDGIERTASDTQTDWANLEFSYCAGNFISPAGIRVEFNAYKNSEKGEWKIDAEKWNTELELAKKETEVTGALLD